MFNLADIIYNPPPEISLNSISYPLESNMYTERDFSQSTTPP